MPAAGAGGYRTPRWVLRLLAVVIVPALLLGTIEAGLRLGGYGYDPNFFLPRTINGEWCFVENPDFGRRFFPPRLTRVPPPLTLKARKAPGTIRILVFGESAALGDPRPQFGAARYLGALLRERYPDQVFELINTSMTAINSHVIRCIADECARHEADAWIVFMGNNEMVGPFGAATVFGPQAPPRGFVRMTVALQRTRLGQLLADVGRRLRPGSETPGDWGGMEMFLRNEIPPGDPRRAAVHLSFTANLSDIVRAGRRAGAEVILSTVAVNLKDCPPFGSQSAAMLAEADRAAFTTRLAEALAAGQRGDFAAALEHLTEATRLHPGSAEARYLLATALLRNGNAEAARREFALARDLDALPFRADSRMNAAVLAWAAASPAKGATVCDPEALLSRHAPHGIPGDELFYEHVHLNFDGNYWLGRAWAEVVAERVLTPAGAKPASAAWASQSECERRLGLTDWNRASVLEEMIERMGRPPLSHQANNPARRAALATRRDELRARLTNAPPDEARAVYEDAIRRAPAEAALRENFAEFLERTGAFSEAIAQRRQVRDLHPHSYFPHFTLGTLLKEQRQFAEARTNLARAVELNPLWPEARLELGAVLALLKEWDAARREFETVRRLQPEDARAALFLGDVLGRLNQPEAALGQLREAVRLRPDHAEARYRLGEALVLRRSLEEAAAEFAEAVRLQPDHARARVNFGVALARQGRLTEAIRQFDEALRLDPRNEQALAMKRQAEAQMRGGGR